MLKQSEFKKEDDLHRIDLGEGISLKGISVAGVNTHISVPELKLCFDVGYSHPSLSSHKHYFITHAHMDHASGIPYIISNKSLNKLSDFCFYMPQSMKPGMDKIMKLWAELEAHDYSWNFQESHLNKEFPVNSSWYVKSFKTFHRVESNGYCLFQRKHKLKDEYKNCDQQELIDLKNKNIVIEEKQDRACLAVTGDTKIEFLEENPYLWSVDYLVMETTYASDVKSIESCREWGHIHLDELLERLSQFNGKNIILKHFSRRHRFHEVLKILDTKVKDPKMRRKLLVLPF